MNIEEVFSAFLGSGLALAIVTLVLFIGKNWFLVRLRESVAHEYAENLEHTRSELQRENQRLLEQLRAEIAGDEAARNVATAALSAANVAVIQKRVEAIEVLWKTIQSVGKSTPNWLAVLDMLGYREEWAGPALLDSIRNFDIIKLNDSIRINDPVWECRPFLGERLFSLFYAYQAMHGSAQSITFFRYQKDGRLPRWWEDDHSKKLLNSVLSSEEMTVLASLKIGQYQWIKESLESKMLAEIERILSGEVGAAQSLERARQIISAARGLEQAGEISTQE